MAHELGRLGKGSALGSSGPQERDAHALAPLAIAAICYFFLFGCSSRPRWSFPVAWAFAASAVWVTPRTGLSRGLALAATEVVSLPRKGVDASMDEWGCSSFPLRAARVLRRVERRGGSGDADGSHPNGHFGDLVSRFADYGRLRAHGDEDTATGGGAGTGVTDALSGLPPGSSQGSFHSRFDRLPRRYERLLERIELGRDVRAALARLRALLASASPQLQARVLRLIRMEIRRLERGGLTRREQAAVQRLRRILTRLDAQAGPLAEGGPWSPGQIADAGAASGTAGGGVGGARAGSQSRPDGSPLASRDEPPGDRATPRGALPSPLAPSSALGWLLLLLLLLAGAGCFLLLLSLAPRSSLPSPMGRIVAGRRRQMRTLALTVVLTGLLGVGVVVLLA